MMNERYYYKLPLNANGFISGQTLNELNLLSFPSKLCDGTHFTKIMLNFPVKAKSALKSNHLNHLNHLYTQYSCVLLKLTENSIRFRK